MKLLIIDDDIPTVEVVRDSVDWKALGISQVLTAYNISMAKPLLGGAGADIAICDIAMPQGSGLDLLAWARENGIRSEFIFLTNHESFEFAATAIQHQAIGYILKPLDAEQLTREVVRAIEKVRQERQLKEYSQYGDYWIQNKSVVEQRFWHDMLFRIIAPDREIIEGELKKLDLDIKYGSSIRLVLATTFWSEEALAHWGENNRGILEYSISKMMSEVILEQFTTVEHTVGYGRMRVIYVACVLEEHRVPPDLDERCQRLIQLCRGSLGCEVTCYLGRAVPLEQLSSLLVELEEWDRNNIQHRGQVLKGGPLHRETANTGIDFSDLGQLLMQGDRMKLLTTVKERIEEYAAGRKLDAAAMHAVQQNIMQAVYVYLYNKGIQPDALFGGDRNSIRLMNQAVNSLYDMIKWESHFINKALDYDRELQKGAPVVDQAKAFVRAHYMENITRNEVAEHVFLTPEYFAKLFKKETGLAIKEYINRCRIEQAKQLLDTTDAGIGDIACRVGFENMPYFSTLFKKQEGCTPNEYRARGD